MSDTFGPLIIVIVVGVFTGLGLTFLTGDYRHFRTIEKQCKELGYIQNETTRIICKVEKNEAN